MAVGHEPWDLWIHVCSNVFSTWISWMKFWCYFFLKRSSSHVGMARVGGGKSHLEWACILSILVPLSPVTLASLNRPEKPDVSFDSCSVTSPSVLPFGFLTFIPTWVSSRSFIPFFWVVQCIENRTAHCMSCHWPPHCLPLIISVTCNKFSDLLGSLLVSWDTFTAVFWKGKNNNAFWEPFN